MPTVRVVVILGQSNAVGRAQVMRLENPLTNPRGYVKKPARGIYIYDKGNVAEADLSPDNGVWAPYYAGVNSRGDGNPGDHFGPELSMAQHIHRETGDEVFIIKAAFGGTALTDGPPTYWPGNWSEDVADMAIDYYFTRALRDLRKIRPNAEIELVGALWWQGETDAANNVPPAEYIGTLAPLLDKFEDALGLGLIPWALVGLNYLQTSPERAISEAIAKLCRERKCEFIDTVAFPRKIDLLPQQAAPMPAGEYDDEHASYITQLAVGETAARAFLSARPLRYRDFTTFTAAAA